MHIRTKKTRTIQSKLKTLQGVLMIAKTKWKLIVRHSLLSNIKCKEIWDSILKRLQRDQHKTKWPLGLSTKALTLNRTKTWWIFKKLHLSILMLMWMLCLRKTISYIVCFNSHSFHSKFMTEMSHLRLNKATLANKVDMWCRDLCKWMLLHR